MDYDAGVWRDQVVDFVREVVVNCNNDSGERGVVIAGNSLGGYTAMYASADERIKDVVKGCVLLNSAGRFRDPDEGPKSDPNPIIESISKAIQRMVIAASFVYTKQPARIEQILRQVYPVNGMNVDEELVSSIQTPSLDPNAAEVFYRVITKNGKGPQAYVDDIIEQLSCPVLLCWGEKDPWIRSAAADRMQRLHMEKHGEGSVEKYMRRVSVDAGHCPHDESPEEVNRAILEFVDEVF
jgi:pimeloyl-ACP methyl ester carboxylesterase